MLVLLWLLLLLRLLLGTSVGDHVCAIAPTEVFPLAELAASRFACSAAALAWA